MTSHEADGIRAEIDRLMRSVDRLQTGARGAAPLFERGGMPDDEAQEVARLRAELGIVKAALRSEREETIALRAQLEELQAGREAEQARGEALRGERDLWAERARILASPLFRMDADEERGAERPPTGPRLPNAAPRAA